jgi:hypothetical protein
MYIDKLLTSTLSWVDKMINFIIEFKMIFVIGFLAMMVSKAFKVNIKI